MKTSTKRTVLAVGLVLAFGGWAFGTTPDGSPAEEQAAEILAATGVNGGLVVHVGCGGGELTAASRAGAGNIPCNWKAFKLYQTLEVW